jgi:quinol monooxygenase YgiN
MIVVEAWMTVRPGAEQEFAAAGRAAMVGTHTEADYREYTCTQDLSDPTRFVFIEEWEDLAALGRHTQTPHYLAFAEVAAACVVEKRIRIHDVEKTTER